MCIGILYTPCDGRQLLLVWSQADERDTENSQHKQQQQQQQLQPGDVYVTR